MNETEDICTSYIIDIGLQDYYPRYLYRINTTHQKEQITQSESRQKS